MNTLYSKEPENKKEFTEKFDEFYTAFAKTYDILVKILPIWSNWLKKVIPYLKGPRVLEVSFGTGYLMTKYADKFETHGIDYNERMATIAKKNIQSKGILAHLQVGNAESLPFMNETFDTIINTMAFSGYPDGTKAMEEMYRVLKRGGRIVLIDFTYPKDRNLIGMNIAKCWAKSGDVIRDMSEIFNKFNFEYIEREIGGFGSVHLYVADKK